MQNTMIELAPLLEGYIDKYGVTIVIETIGSVARDKSQQDTAMAEPWDKLAAYMDKVASSRIVRDCPLP